MRPDDAIRVVVLLKRPLLLAISMLLLALAMLWAVQMAPPLLSDGHLISPQFGAHSASESAEERQLQAEVNAYLESLESSGANQDTGPVP